MRIPPAAIFLAASALVVWPGRAQQAAIANQKAGDFHRCTSDMALWTMRRKEGEIDKKRVVDEVLSDCLLQMPNEVLLGSERDRNAWMSQARREVAAQVEKLAPAAKAERADEDQVGANYFLCLERHAKMLALATDEAADIVAQASISACPAERAAVVEVHRRYDDIVDEGAMKVMDSGLVQKLLLEIVEIRAKRNITPSPGPRPRKTPI